MNLLILTRTLFRPDGIFGELTDGGGRFIAKTLEHAYPPIYPEGLYQPKLPQGVYTCIRGQHQLHGMTQPFETFEVMDVPGHTGILFHVGNFNKDSDGCVLLGQDFSELEDASMMILNSKKTFQAFMKIQEGIDSFQLTVIG